MLWCTAVVATSLRGTRSAPILVTVADKTPVTLNRNQRVLAYMAASSLGLSLISIIAIMIAAVQNVDFTQGIWSTVAVLPLIGLPFAFLLIIAFFIVTAIRRSRAAEDA